MNALAAAVGSVLLNGAAMALTLFDHPRLAIGALAVGGLLLTYSLSASLRRPRS